MRFGEKSPDAPFALSADRKPDPDRTGTASLPVAWQAKGTFARALAFSPDGKTLAIGSGREVKRLDAATGKELPTLKSEAVVESLAWSPDGTTLFAGQAAHTAYEGETVARWRVADGQSSTPFALKTPKGKSPPMILGLAVSPGREATRHRG